MKSHSNICAKLCGNSFDINCAATTLGIITRYYRSKMRRRVADKTELTRQSLGILERRNEYVIGTCLIHSIDRSIGILVPNLSIVYSLVPFRSVISIQDYRVADGNNVYAYRFAGSISQYRASRYSAVRWKKKIVIIARVSPVRYILTPRAPGILN